MNRMIHTVMPHARCVVLVLFSGILVALAAPARATWSICIANKRTKEVCVGTVTCLNNFDLCAIVPVVVVGKGTGACQSAGDFDGRRRPVMFNELLNETDPEIILEMLAQISGHQQRQYGIVDTLGRGITYSGSQNGAWAGGVFGVDGEYVYAIQGNVLAGACVVDAIELAVLATEGDMGQKLMAGMEAAYLNGGDGRCSCNPNQPTSCGCPPVDFTKSGHIGCMVVARVGDSDDPLCNRHGCADGDYYMRLNVAFQASQQPDPVLQLRDMFDEWRLNQLGRPDGLNSIGYFDEPYLQADGVSSTIMTIELLDIDGNPISASIDSISIQHAADSAGSSTIGTVNEIGGGVYEVELIAGTLVGTDRFEVLVDDGVHPVVIMPRPEIGVTNVFEFEITTGTLTSGGIEQLVRSDDDALRARSGFGPSFTDLHKMAIEVEAQTFHLPPETIDIEVESRLDHPTGIVRLSLFNWFTGEFDAIGQGPVSNIDSIISVAGVDAEQYVTPATKRMRLQVNEIVFVPFLAFQFDAFIDLIEIRVN